MFENGTHVQGKHGPRFKFEVRSHYPNRSGPGLTWVRNLRCSIQR